MTCFGNADRLLWRPFVGLGYGHIYDSALAARFGVEALVPLWDAKDAAGLFLQALVETAFASNDYADVRVGPMVALRAGIAFDVL